MAARLAVLLVHGMGNPTPSFALPLVERVARVLGPRAREIAFEACYWGDLLQRQQDVTWQRLQRAPMRHRAARRWIVSALGDPVSYLSGYLRDVPGAGPARAPAYVAVHARLRESLRTLAARTAPDAPLVALAHSLGGVVVSNHVWDEQRRHGALRPRAELAPPEAPTAAAHEAVDAAGGVAETPMERMETLAGLVTYGCNIPLFLPPSAPIECIAFPPPALPAPWRDGARWLNVYDPDDLLGYPIAEVWDELHGTVIVDRALEVGGVLTGWTPWAHTLYDTDDDFVALVADELRRVLDAGR